MTARPEAQVGRKARLWLSDWPETRDTMHMWTQIIGKVRMAHAPLLNHWWQATLYVAPRGLTTSAIPHPRGAFDVELVAAALLLRIPGATIRIRPRRA